MDFELLPEEIKVMVFSYFSTRELLSIIAPVSEYWKILALKPTLWKDIEFNNNDENCPIEAQDLVKHLNRSHLARQIEFSFTRDFNWFVHLNTLEFVRKLVFNYCNVGVWELFQFVKKCPNVESFCLITYGCPENEKWFRRNCLQRNKKVKLAMIEQITKWEKLKSLKLSYEQCATDDDELLILFANRCKMIEDLSWISMNGVTEKSLNILIEQRGPQLKSLELVILNFEDEGAVFEVLQKCEKIETIILIDSGICLSDFMTLSKLPQLKRLEFENCNFCLSEYLKTFGDFTFNSLEDAVFGYFDWSREVVDLHFPRLKTIDESSIDEYFRSHDK